MAGMDIATGALSAHDSSGATGNVLHPIDASATPGVQAPTAIQPGQLDGPTIPALDTTAMFQSQMAAGEADVRAAQAAGQAAENDRRQHYAGDILPLGAAYGDLMDLPRVPEDASGSATPPAGGYLYGSGQGDQPGRGDA